jgi:chromosome segregation ATPase
MAALEGELQAEKSQALAVLDGLRQELAGVEADFAGRRAELTARVEELEAIQTEQAEDLKASQSEKAQALAGLEELQRELAALGAHQAANQARMEAELQEARAVAARLEGLATEREAAHAEELEASQAEAAENMGELAGSLALLQQEVAQVDGSMQAAGAKSEKLSQRLAEMTLERDALRAELGAAREVAEVGGEAAEVGKLGALRAAAASDASAAALLLAKTENALEALESKLGGGSLDGSLAMQLQEREATQSQAQERVALLELSLREAEVELEAARAPPPASAGSKDLEDVKAMHEVVTQEMQAQLKAVVERERQALEMLLESEGRVSELEHALGDARSAAAGAAGAAPEHGGEDDALRQELEALREECSLKDEVLSRSRAFISKLVESKAPLGP